ncbi:family 10 glycosyl hydrolase [Microdochium trichocladiopsis]|uniref:Beta-xylanase n=1 Tax=Microdochium trichocladiopsis TaxID=1682393 RepID=A0A9P8YKC2_9PEZI|nr:family 10 glycosyl hydrolase [Microdochium trichocladiopsis]KAH7041542.1 family 10 glycosyl hydrolase [Microdochium trichocladiopsis]
MRTQHLGMVLLALASAGEAQLNALAKRAGKLYFGSATDNGELSDTAYTNILKSEFGSTTPGNGQKWQYTEPNRGQFSFSNGDVVANFAATNNLILRCHTLVWHSQLPSWVSSGSWTQAQLTSIIETHIANVVAHYKGKCYAWDVVNEALNEDGSWRDSVFSRVFGGGNFIPVAFKAAAAADPAAKLYYNDYNIEATGAKQAAAANIVKLVKSSGARIDGVGMQAHLIVGQMPSAASLAATMNSYLSAGATEVAYTELDIRHSSLPASSAALKQQGDDYARITQACLALKACVGITIWDYTDKYSWIPGVFPGQGAALLWDDNLQKKPAYTSVSSVLAAAATGGTNPPPVSSSTTLITSATSTTTGGGTTQPTGCTAKKYDQCGGEGWMGCTVCASGSTCKVSNQWYSQCL